MRKISLIILCFVLLSMAVQAQIVKPVNWNFAAVKKSAGLYELQMTATIQSGWKIYSGSTPDGGPLPTKVTFKKNPLVLLGGKIKEVGDLKKVHEEAFGVDVLYYQNKLDLAQVMKVKGKAKTSISGTVEFMACDESQCLPPQEVEFKLELK